MENFRDNFNLERCKRVERIIFRQKGVYKGERAEFTSTKVNPSLKKVVSDFEEDHPVNVFACELAKLNKVKIRIGQFPYKEFDPEKILINFT